MHILKAIKILKKLGKILNKYGRLLVASVASKVQLI